MRMGQGGRTGLGHGGITCVLQTQFSSLLIIISSRNFSVRFLPLSITMHALLNHKKAK